MSSEDTIKAIFPSPEKEVKEEKPDEKIVAAKAINALLQKGIEFDITVDHPSVFHRLKILPKIRILKIYPAHPGALLNISKIILTMDDIGDLESEDLFETGLKNIVANKDKILEVIALAIMNRKISNPYLIVQKWRLKRFLNWNTSTNELLQLVQIALVQMGVTDFLALSALIKRMNLMEAGNQEQTSSTGGKCSEG